MKDNRRVKIFDTTLRDGQQCPGAGMSFEKNLEYARLAHLVGVDILEAGFPSASKVDFDIVNEISEELSSQANSPTIAGLCQLRDEQIDKTIEALLPAVKYQKARMHTYLPVDPKLMIVSLGSERVDHKKLIKDLHNFVARAVQAGLEVEFSPEGYSRQGANFDFVTDLFRAAIEAGCSVFNCPDTIGGAYRLQGEEYFVNKMNKHAAIIAAEFPDKEITWSVHCHNDFGLAVENSLNGVFFGPARQIEGCFNGIGERAGNAALEQCVMLIKSFAKMHDAQAPLFTNIRTEKIKQICDFVAKYMLPCQPHWPVTGLNAAKHSSGGHTNAVLKDPLAYQPFDPREVGSEISFLFGPLSGGNHAKSIIRNAGYVCDDEEKVQVGQFIKEHYSDRRKGVTDEELIRGYLHYRAPIKIDQFEYSRNSKGSEIQIFGEFFGKSGEFKEFHEGKDSALAALKKAVDRNFPGTTIVNYASESDSKGIDALSRSRIIIATESEEVFEGKGVDADIEIAAMRALIDAVNQAYISKHYLIRD